MFLTIDIGTSSYKGHILTPSDQYSFQHVTDRTTSGAQAFYVEHAWYFDSLIVVETESTRRTAFSTFATWFAF